MLQRSSEQLYHMPEAPIGTAADGWDPDDMLLLPLRSASREILGFVSVDQPDAVTTAILQVSGAETPTSTSG